MGFDDADLFESDGSLLDRLLAGVDAEALRRDAVVRLPLPEDLRPYSDGGFATRSGRHELANAALESEGHGRVPEHRGAVEGPHGAMRARYPLILMSPKSHQRFLNTSYSHLDAHARPEGGPYCELTESDASARGISDGDTVRVYNDRGEIVVPARVVATPRTRDGMVIVPFGWGWPTCVNALTSDAPTDWGGGVAFYDTLVEVARHEDGPLTPRN